MDNFEYTKAFDHIWNKIQQINKDINDLAPWSVAKTDPEKAKDILTDLDLRLLDAVVLLKPFLPETANKIAEIFSASSIAIPQPLFPKAK